MDECFLNVQYYFDYECFILGGCMMVNFSYFCQGCCYILFVCERGVMLFKCDFFLWLFLSGGICNNVWCIFFIWDYVMVVCNFIGNKKVSLLCYVMLNSVMVFICYVYNYFFLLYFNWMFSGNVVVVLDYLKFEYNVLCN